jgi:hypothetical protein
VASDVQHELYFPYVDPVAFPSVDATQPRSQVVYHLTNSGSVAPYWLGRPALGKIAIAWPVMWRQLAHYNSGTPYRHQIEPFGVLLHAPAPRWPSLKRIPDDAASSSK